MIRNHYQSVSHRHQSPHLLFRRRLLPLVGRTSVGHQKYPGPKYLYGVCTVLVFALLEFAVEPRLYNRRQFSSLLVILLVVALWNAAGVFGLLAAPPLAAALQILVASLLAPGTAAVAQPIEERFAALEGRLANLDASLGAAPETPSPQVANLVSRLTALVSKARQALSKRGALPAETDAATGPSGPQPPAASPSAAPSGGLSEARRR